MVVLSMQWTPTRAAGLEQFAAFLPKAGRRYADARNFDDGTGRSNVSLLSPWLHAGLLNETEVCTSVLAKHSPQKSEKFIAEVFWRVYFKGYLEQHPSVWAEYCKDRDAAFSRLETNTRFERAYSEAIYGRTGIEAFDVWARELMETGYLHNHARMWFASIWIFTLKLDWQLGADLFLRNLIDGDAASNTLSWRWVAGLHTKGKAYLARQDNIATYTVNHPDGPLPAEGLAMEATALEEPRNHPRQPLSLPDVPSEDAFAEPFALMLHDEAASHAPLTLPNVPSLVIGAARPAARSPREMSDKALSFAEEAVAGSLSKAADAFGCKTTVWDSEQSLANLLSDAGVTRVVTPYLPIGWTRDALWPELSELQAAGNLVTLLPELDRATWPHAKAGFFGVKKQIESILGELGVG